jgi:hypothetical protein
VACGTAGEEVIVAASALEKGLKVLLLIPPLAEASCGAISIRIAMTAKAMRRQFKGNLPRLRGAFMMIRSFPPHRWEIVTFQLTKDWLKFSGSCRLERLDMP